MATAQNLLHRFYWRKSLNDERFDAFTVAMASVFLATKVGCSPSPLLPLGVVCSSTA